ncbi:MFS transporter [Streptomyces sp. NPDC017936]|uniref:MFS transporter n=1 Tax=Streptomyces sp. NPDC017936 TaxID=3365016 RepID=UPI0037B27264
MSRSTQQPTKNHTASGTRPPRHHGWILGTVGLAQLMVVLDATIVNIALPSAQQDLGFSDSDRQWIVTAYALAFGSLLLLGGRVADLLGRRRTFAIGMAGFAATSALGGAAGTLGLLIAARAGQGAFAALLAPAALSLLSTTFTQPKERATAFTVYGAIAGAGGAVGLLLGGLLTEHFSWRWTLYVNIAFAAVTLAAAPAVLPRDRRDTRPRLDIPGTLLVSTALFGLVYGCANAESHGWSAAITYGPLAAGILLLAAFAFWQTRTDHPLLPLRILADRNRLASLLALAVVGAGMFGVFLFLTFYMQQSLHYTPISTGMAFLPMIAALGLASTLASKVVIPRTGPGAVVPLGLLLAGAGLAWMTTLDLTSSYPTQLLPQLLITGAGMGLTIAPAMETATHGVRPSDAGAASATVNTVQQVGGSLGTALLTTFSTQAAADYLTGKNATAPDAAAQAALHSYAAAFWWSAGFFAAGAAATLVLYRRDTPARQDGSAPLHM